jgi:hypothetical protein
LKAWRGASSPNLAVLDGMTLTYCDFFWIYFLSSTRCISLL